MSQPYQGNDGTQGNGGWQPASPHAEPSYGQGSPSYGQSSPSYGQSSALSYGSPNAGGGYGQPAGGYSSPAPGGYGQYQAPAKRKGLKRIIVGIIAMILGGIGVILGAILGTVFGLLFSLSSIGDDATALGNGGQVSVTSGSYVVAVPSSDSGATCTTTGDPASAISTSPQSGDLTFTSGGDEYAVVDTVSASGDAHVTVTCTGTENVVIAPLPAGGMIGGFFVGVGLPALLGLIGLILLIWGIVARVRSGRAARGA